MDYFWTSNKPIFGLRHFVLVNNFKEKDQIYFLMVSVVDVEITSKVSKKELINSGNWSKGWLNLPESESITKSYKEYKLRNTTREVIKKVFVNKNSIFNIS